MGRARSHQPKPATVKDTRPTTSLGGTTQGSGEASASPLVVNEPLSSTLITRWVKVELCPGGRNETSSPGCSAPSSGCMATSDPTQTVGHMDGVVITIRRPPERYQPNTASALTLTDTPSTALRAPTRGPLTRAWRAIYSSTV